MPSLRRINGVHDQRHKPALYSVLKVVCRLGPCSSPPNKARQRRSPASTHAPLVLSSYMQTPSRHCGKFSFLTTLYHLFPRGLRTTRVSQPLPRLQHQPSALSSTLPLLIGFVSCTFGRRQHMNPKKSGSASTTPL